jgi:hypothetical protein
MMRIFHKLSVKISQFNRVPDSEFVGVGTLLTSGAAGVVAFFQFDASLLASLAVVPVAYTVLFACFASRYTQWLPIGLGTITMTAIPTAACFGIGSHLLGTSGHWVGTVVGLAIGLAISARAYWSLLRLDWRSSETA